LLKGEAQW